MVEGIPPTMTRNRASSRLRLQTAMARCAQLCATASRSAAVTIKAFGHPAIAVFALDLRKRSSFVFSIVTLRHIRHLHTLWVRKCCMSRSVLFLVYIYSSVGEHAFMLQRYAMAAGWHRHSCGTCRKSSFQSKL